MKFARFAVIGLIAFSLTGCTVAATTTPTRSAVSNPPSTPAAQATPAVVDGLPSSCNAFFSPLKMFVFPDGSLVLNPAWKSGAGVSRSEANGYGSYDPTLAPILSHNAGVICDWAPPAGPSDTFLTTQFRHVDDATAQMAIAHLEQLNWGCSPVYGGMWCLTNDSHTGRSIGESQYFGHGDWIASDWNNAGPETYTPRLLQRLFG